MAPRPLVDSYGRVHTDLRISVTDRCNFRCTYCMPEEGMQWLPREELLTFEELERLARRVVLRSGRRTRVLPVPLTGGSILGPGADPGLDEKLELIRRWWLEHRSP